MSEQRPSYGEISDAQAIHHRVLREGWLNNPKLSRFEYLDRIARSNLAKDVLARASRDGGIDLRGTDLYSDIG